MLAGFHRLRSATVERGCRCPRRQYIWTPEPARWHLHRPQNRPRRRSKRPPCPHGISTSNCVLLSELSRCAPFAPLSLREFKQASLFVHQFGIGTHFNYLTGFHHSNPVIIFDDIQAVHDGNQRAFTFPLRFQQTLDF